MAGDEVRTIDACEQTNGATIWARIAALGGAAAAVGWRDPQDTRIVDHRFLTSVAFGATTGRLLGRDAATLNEISNLSALWGVFNLGISLVDGLCDQETAIGNSFLHQLSLDALTDAVERPRAAGWLRRAIASVLIEDPRVGFTVEIIEAFFVALHAVHDGRDGLRLRRRAGSQLVAALEAEREAIAWQDAKTARHSLIEVSRRKSVLPFEILETLSTGGRDGEFPAAGTAIGEAVWRIDDLIDLCRDARSRSLNAVLLESSDLPLIDVNTAALAALDPLSGSTRIESTVAEAVDRLANGMDLARPAPRLTAADRALERRFLHFIHRWVGIGRQ